MAMNARECYLETMLFGAPDRIPFAPGGPRRSTLRRWHAEGLSPDRPWSAVLREEVGLPDPSDSRSRPQPGVHFRMNPIFEEKVLEHRGGHYIVQDWMGNITEISDEFDYTYIRNAIDFVTRKWHRFPVETRTDFEAMKQRYIPDDSNRYPDDFASRVTAMRDRDYVVSIGFPGPFWQLREWVGFEPLCMMFLDDPGFVSEMIEFWAQFVSQTMAPVLDAGVVDRVFINEDMAYKSKSMISPAMTREFLLPVYRRWIREARQAGVPIIDMDSDGNVELLIPIWIEAGINVCDPIEVAAGNDLNAYRRQHGRRMAYRMGIDKRCIAKGGSTLEAELTRVAPVLRDGGYIPGCDHGVPPDISWPNFLDYARLLAELTGWR